MKEPLRIIIPVLLVIFGAFSYWVKTNAHNPDSLVYSEGDQFQSVTLSGLDDQSIQLQNVFENNKLTWVNFWATWCGPCREEMPMMAELYNEYGDKGLAIVAISVGESDQTVRNYLGQYPVPFTILTDSSRSSSRPLNIEVLPTSFLVDSTGTVVESGTGIQNWTYEIQRRLDDE